MKHELMKLPYEYDALEPMMSKETLEFHHGKHHQTYVNKLNELIVGTHFEDMSLVDIIKKSEGGIYNNAAQIYNHDFFWKSLNPYNTKVSTELEHAISANYGLFEDLQKEFIAKATTHFGSGWVWLVVDEMGKLKIITTSNADTPLTLGLHPLLVCDVWEHAYYIDYRNVRPDYLKNFWKLINWNFVSENYKALRELVKPNYIDECNENSAECNYIHNLVDEERTVS